MTRARQKWLTIIYSFAVTALLIYTFAFNFDITDEGLYLYNFFPHHDYANYNFYFLPFLYLNRFLNFGLYEMRWLCFLSQSLSAYLVYNEYRKFRKEEFRSDQLAYFALFSFAVYSSLSTFSYNTTTYLGAALLFSAVIRLLRLERLSLVAFIYSVLAVFLVTSSRVSGGLIFLGILAIVIFQLKQDSRFRRLIFFFSVMAVVASLCFLTLKGSLIGSHMIPLIGVFAKTTYSNIFSRYTFEILVWLRRAYLAPIVLLFIAHKISRASRRSNVVLMVNGIYYLYVLGKFIYPDFDFFRGIYFFYGLILANLSYLFYWKFEEIKKNRIYFEICVFGAVIATLASFGTNNPITHWNALYLMMLLPTVEFVGRLWDMRISRWTTQTLILVMGMTVFFNQFYQYYRSPNRSQTAYETVPWRPLRYIQLPEDLARVLKVTNDKLAELGFDPKRDAIVSYKDMPGFVSAFGYQSYGQPWFLSGSEKIDDINCYYLNAEVAKFRHIYLLLNGPLSDQIKNCLDKTIEVNLPVQALTIGQFYHRSYEKMVELEIKGPYPQRN